MDLKEILAISGYSGLFKLVSQGKNNIIVESLVDKSRMPAFSNQRISALEDIAIFTENEEVPLKEVFRKLYEHTDGKSVVGSKSSADEMKKVFSTILPDYDRERVYVSDIKKVFSWYNLLLDRSILNAETINEPVAETEAEEPVENKVKEEAKKADKKEVAKEDKPAKEKQGKAKSTEKKTKPASEASKSKTKKVE